MNIVGHLRGFSVNNSCGLVTFTVCMSYLYRKYPRISLAFQGLQTLSLMDFLSIFSTAEVTRLCRIISEQNLEQKLHLYTKMPYCTLQELLMSAKETSSMKCVLLFAGLKIQIQLDIKLKNSYWCTLLFKLCASNISYVLMMENLHQLSSMSKYSINHKL